MGQDVLFFLPKYLVKKEELQMLWLPSEDVILRSKQIFVAILPLRENEGKYSVVMSCDQRIWFYDFCHSSWARLRFCHSLHLLSPAPEKGLCVLDSWVLLGWSVSLESLVHCCLLESFGFQRQGPLLENKSEHVATFFCVVVVVVEFSIS